jgi:hypothetical protein
VVVPFQPTCKVDPPHDGVDDEEEMVHAEIDAVLDSSSGDILPPGFASDSEENFVSMTPCPNEVVETPGAAAGVDSVVGCVAFGATSATFTADA